MNVIAAVDEQWGIGLNNKLLVSIPNDHKFFREMTAGRVVVFGRKTLDTFPGRQPLAGRINIVLTRDPDFCLKGAAVVHSLEELSAKLLKYRPEDIFIIGGESIYRQLLPRCSVAHITKIHHSYEADSHFPNLDQMAEWRLVQDSEEQTYFDLEYVFLKYERIKTGKEENDSKGRKLC